MTFRGCFEEASRFKFQLAPVHVLSEHLLCFSYSETLINPLIMGMLKQKRTLCLKEQDETEMGKIYMCHLISPLLVERLKVPVQTKRAVALFS